MMPLLFVLSSRRRSQQLQPTAAATSGHSRQGQHPAPQQRHHVQRAPASSMSANQLPGPGLGLEAKPGCPASALHPLAPPTLCFAVAFDCRVCSSQCSSFFLHISLFPISRAPPGGNLAIRYWIATGGWLSPCPHVYISRKLHHATMHSLYLWRHARPIHQLLPPLPADAPAAPSKRQSSSRCLLPPRNAPRGPGTLWCRLRCQWRHDPRLETSQS